MTTYSYRASGFKDQGAFKPFDLFAGEFPVVRRKKTLAGTSKAFLQRGTVLGRIEKSGFYTISCKTMNGSPVTDGSQIPVAILAEDIDLNDKNDKEAVIYYTGEFNTDVLIFGQGHDEKTAELSLKANSIFLRKNQGA